MFFRRNNPFTLWGLGMLLLALSGLGTRAVQAYHPVYGDPMLEPWCWHSFPELNGLSTQCMAEGPGGGMWFGTVDSLWSYDGIKWVKHDDAGGFGVVSICSGTNGDLYISNTRDIRRCADGQWSRIFHLSARRFRINKLISGRDGELWAATSLGLLCGQPAQSQWTLFTSPKIAARLRGEERSSFLNVELLPDSVLNRPRPNLSSDRRSNLSEIYEDHQGRLWLGTDGGEILCFHPGATNASAATGRDWTLYNESDGLVCGVEPSILQLRNGSVWVVYGSKSGCVNIFNGTSWRKVDLAKLGVPGDCGNLLQTRDGTVWLSARYELAAYRGGRWKTYMKPAVPIPSARNLLLEASDGALWICGPGTEIERVDYDSPRWLTLRDLNFGWESPGGTQWFLHRDGRVVVHKKNGPWISYGVEDGLMDAPVALLGTKSGDVWVAGSDHHEAAMARFDGRKWTRFVRKDFSWGVDWRAVFESSDGSVWFGAAVDSHGPKAHLDGLLQFHDGHWIHHCQPGRFPPGTRVTNPAILLPATQRPEPVGKFYCLGESPGGKIWAGHTILADNNGRKWSRFLAPSNIQIGTIEAMLTDKAGALWIGSRQFGALRYDGHEWQQFQGWNSLVANSVRSLAQTTDGSIWAATDRDVSRFDGRTWTADVLPAALNIPEQGGDLKASASGALWINRFTRDWVMRAWPKAPHPDSTNGEFWTVCHRFQGKPPQTEITSGATTVSSLGNISILWNGTSAWREPHESRLQFSFRLDGHPWSAYTSAGGHAFFALPSGSHHFEVRARDRDFNMDPTPAVLDFVVLPPVWRRPWFVGLMLLLFGLIITQTIRVLQERGRLRRAHDELEERVRQRTAQLQAANEELESFSYSVSHDLRAPLRSIDGFSRILLDKAAAQLDAQGRANLERVCAASQRMGRLIDDLLRLSRISRGELHLQAVNLSDLAASIVAGLQAAEPGRRVEIIIAPNLMARGDARLIQIALENLFGNAWKFTSRQPEARIEFSVTQQQGEMAFYVRDNGAGFDMTYADKLFGAFQRLHSMMEFPGAGIGLATVQRIIHRHGGHIWAESRVDEGTTFYFTLQDNP